MLEIYLAKWENQGVWLRLPYTKEDLEQAKTRLDEIEPGFPEIYLGDVKSSVPGMTDFVRSHLLQKTIDLVDEQTLRELNFLAKRVEQMTEEQQGVFGAAIQIEGPLTLEALVNLSCNLDKFKVYPDIMTEEKLGEYLLQKEGGKIPEELKYLLDNRSIGHKYAENHMGGFTETGYVFRSGTAFDWIYNGGQELPDPCFETNSPLVLEVRAEKKSRTLYLPMQEGRLERVRRNLKLSSFEECEWISVKENMDGLKRRLPCGASVEELNRLAAAISRTLDGGEKQQEVLLAALEAEAPASVEEAVRVIEEVKQYAIYMRSEEYTSPADYARKALEESGRYHVDEFTAGFVNFEALGRALMKNDGAVQTSYGIVTRKDHGIYQLPEERTTLRLFGPLTASLFLLDEWGGATDHSMKLIGYELCPMEEEIRKAVVNECGYLNPERGLAEYLDHEFLKRKVFSMKPDVAVWDDQLWGVLEVQSYGELSPGEMKELAEAWSGQCSDGWGEGLEQEAIRTPKGDLYVSFWQSGGDYCILPEQELKQGRMQNFEPQMGGM